MREGIQIAPLRDRTVFAPLTLEDSVRNLCERYLGYAITQSKIHNIQSELNYFSDKYADELVFNGVQHILYADYEEFMGINNIKIYPIKLLDNNKQGSIFELCKSKIEWT